MQIVIGSESGSKWMSEDLFIRTASKDKSLHIIQGSNHMQLYDVPQYITEAAAFIVTLFHENL